MTFSPSQAVYLAILNSLPLPNPVTFHFRYRSSAQKPSNVFTNWSRGRALARRFAGCPADLLCARRSLHDPDVHLSHTVGGLEQRRWSQVRHQARWPHGIREGEFDLTAGVHFTITTPRLVVLGKKASRCNGQHRKEPQHCALTGSALPWINGCISARCAQPGL